MNWFSDVYRTDFKQSERNIQLDTLATMKSGMRYVSGMET